MRPTLKLDERFPEGIKELFSHLAGQAIYAREKWTMFRALYLESPENVELLKEVAPAFFAWTQEALIDDLILSLSRMLDPPQTAGPNLVLKRLLDALSPDAKAKLGPTLESCLNSALSTARALRNHRHTRIAHQDLNYFVGEAQLEPATCAQVRETLEHIERFLETIYTHFATDSGSMWPIPDIPGGSDSLLSHLRATSRFGKPGIGPPGFL